MSEIRINIREKTPRHNQRAEQPRGVPLWPRRAPATLVVGRDVRAGILNGSNPILLYD